MKITITCNNVAHEIDENTKIEFVSNPKRAGKNAHARYAKYESAKTLKQYFELNAGKFAMPDLKYDTAHHFLKIFVDGKNVNEKVAEKAA